MKRFTTILTCLMLLAAMRANASWNFREASDALTDEHQAMAATGTNRDGLKFVCFGGRNLQVTAYTDIFLTSGTKPVSVKYRIDKGPIKSETWAAYDGNEVWTEGYKAASFARMLLAGKELIFRAISSYDNDTDTLQIDLADAQEAIGKVLSACDK